MVFCQRCGTQNPAGAQFCQKCGTSLVVSRAGQPSQATQTTLKKNGILGWMIFFACAVLFPLACWIIAIIHLRQIGKGTRDGKDKSLYHIGIVISIVATIIGCQFTQGVYEKLSYMGTLESQKSTSESQDFTSESPVSKEEERNLIEDCTLACACQRAFSPAALDTCRSFCKQVEYYGGKKDLRETIEESWAECPLSPEEVEELANE